MKRQEDSGGFEPKTNAGLLVSVVQCYRQLVAWPYGDSEASPAGVVEQKEASAASIQSEHRSCPSPGIHHEKSLRLNRSASGDCLSHDAKGGYHGDRQYAQALQSPIRALQLGNTHSQVVLQG